MSGRNLFAVGLLIFHTAFAALGAEPANLSFENGMIGWEGYVSVHGAAKFTISSSEAKTGQFCARIEKTDRKGYADWRIAPNPKLEPRRRMRMSAWIKQENVEDAAPYIQIYSFDAGKNPRLCFRRTGKTGTQDWYELSASFAAPADSVSCRVDLGLASGTGVVHFDDVTLAPVGEDPDAVLVNTSFEDEGQWWGSMRTSQMKINPHWDTRIGRTGTHSVRVEGEMPVGYSEWRANPDPILKPGGEYYFSVWVRQELVKRHAPYLEVYSFSETRKPSRIFFKPGITGTQDWYRIHGVFTVPRDSAHCRVGMGMRQATGVTWFDDVTLRLAGAEEKKELAMSERAWKAYWVWPGEPREDQTIYVRKTFDLDFQPREAIARIAVDDAYTLKVNGTLCASDNNWASVETVDLKPFLVQGKNVLTMEATNRYSAAGALFEASLVAENGGETMIISDDSWRCAEQPVAGWESADFDDSLWRRMDMIGQPPCAPWGKLEYFMPYSLRESVDLAGVEGGGQVKAGDTAALTLRLKPNGELKKDAYRIILDIRTPFMELFSRELQLRSSNVSEAGEIQFGPIEIPVSPYCPEATYPIRVESPDLEVRVAAEQASAALTVTAATWPDDVTAEMRNVQGKPVCYLDGKPVPFDTYYKSEGMRTANARRMGDAGVHIHEIGAPWHATEVSEGGLDLSRVAREMVEILDADPKATIIVRFRLDVPGWWAAKHPDECTRGYTGSSSYCQSFASTVWRRDALEFMRRCIAIFRDAPYGRRIIAYNMMAGKGGEFQLWGAGVDYSMPMRQAWAAYVATLYADDASLAKAWGRPGAKRATVALPTPDDFARGSETLIETEGMLRDFAMFLGNVNAQAICVLTRGVKETVGPDKMVGTYYGSYIFEHGKRVFREGTLGIDDVVECEAISFHGSPETYGYRDVGHTGGFMGPVDSIKLRGKNYQLEADIRTLFFPPSGYRASGGLNGTLQVLRREFLLPHAKGVGVRWFDIGVPEIDGFDHPDIYALIRRSAEAGAETAATVSMKSEVAVFIDPRGLSCVGQKNSGGFLSQLTSAQRCEWYRMGAPYDMYLLKDIHRDDLPEYKVYVFLSSLYLTDRDRARMAERVFRNGHTVVWMYGAGLFDADGFNEARMASLIGMPVTRSDAGSMEGVIVRADDPVSRALAAKKTAFGLNVTSGPYFSVAPGDATILGQDAAGRGILARKDMGAWTSVYAATPKLQSPVWREIARAAGVHIYNETDDAFYAGDGVFGLVAREAGEKRILLPDAAKALTVKSLYHPDFTREGDTIRFSAKAGDTAVFTIH